MVVRTLTYVRSKYGSADGGAEVAPPRGAHQVGRVEVREAGRLDDLAQCVGAALVHVHVHVHVHVRVHVHVHVRTWMQEARAARGEVAQAAWGVSPGGVGS